MHRLSLLMFPKLCAGKMVAWWSLLLVVEYFVLGEDVQEVFDFAVVHNDQFSNTQILYQASYGSTTGIWTIDPSDNLCLNPTVSVSVVSFFSNSTIFVENTSIGMCENEFDDQATAVQFTDCTMST